MLTCLSRFGPGLGALSPLRALFKDLVHLVRLLLMVNPKTSC